MKLQTILFPTDFSPASETALEVATAVARDTGARLVILHVKHEPNPNRQEAGISGVPVDPDSFSLTRLLDEVKPADAAVTHVHRLVAGVPAEEILKLAEAERADLVVMATHGRTGLMRLLMGSVAEEVVRRAPCAVLTVKHAAPAGPQEKGGDQ
jgi:nucleotide-binding universal stress UspA family protein